MKQTREKLSSRIGFILLSAGCAIGIGNVWRFPYITGQSGGAWFVLIYFFFLAVLGLPVMLMEFAAGRASQRSGVMIPDTLTPGRTAWRTIGAVGFIGTLVLTMYYTTVAGWMLLYFLKTAGGALSGLPPDAIGGAFGGMLSDPRQQSYAMVFVCELAVVVCAMGLRNGLERVTKWMMGALFVLIVALAVNSMTLSGAGRGLSFFLMPNAANVKAVGLSTVVVNAMNQAFFTLSLGVGIMALFGSYIDKRHTLVGGTANVIILDTVVAISAGLIVIPACFAFNVEPGQGPGLVFVTLPNVFGHMPFGRFWGSLFFIFMWFAAMTTVFTLFENLIACIHDWLGVGRRKVALALAVLIPLLSLPCVLGFNVWAGFEPLGKGTNVLDLEDFIVSDITLPFGSLLFALFCCHRFGWGWKKFIAEVNAGVGPKFPEWTRIYCAYVLPVIILTILVLSIAKHF